MKFEEVQQLLGISCINNSDPSVCICVFYIYLRMISDCFLVYHKLTCFCNREGMCLLCGTS